MDRQFGEELERADSLRLAGRYDEAADAYAKVLEDEPQIPDAWYNLGWVQKQARRYEEALRAYGQALDHGALGPEEIHLNRAVILSDHLARHDEAKDELEAALRCAPDYIPALLNLGNLEEDLGNREAAAAAYRKVLAVQPLHPLALSRLAGVADKKADGDVAERLSAALGRATAPGDRADLGFALGRLLDSRGAHKPAFEAYVAANRAARECFDARARYDRAAAEQMIDRIVSAFPETDSIAQQESPSVFVCGLFRSGSTLTEQMLASHSGLVSGGELDLVPTLASLIPGYPESVAAAERHHVSDWRDFYAEGLAPFRQAGTQVIDKRPDNFLHVGLIKTLFPGARIVHTKRNRLDNILSLYFLHLGQNMPYSTDLADAAHWHGLYKRLMAHWKKLWPDDIFDVDYDRLVDTPRSVTEPLLRFLGLQWEDSVLAFHERRGAVKTASVWQVREKLHSRSSGRWRNYESQLRAALGDGFAQS